MKDNLNKRNIVDWALILAYILALTISDDPIFRGYTLLAISIVGICISLGILLFKKDLNKNQKTREIIGIVLLTIALGFAIFRLYIQ